MNVRCVLSTGVISHDTPLLVLPVHESEEEAEAPKAEVLAPAGLSEVLSGAFPVEDLKHKPGESAFVYLNEGGGPRRVLLLGARETVGLRPRGGTTLFGPRGPGGGVRRGLGPYRVSRIGCVRGCGTGHHRRRCPGGVAIHGDEEPG